MGSADGLDGTGVGINPVDDPDWTLSGLAPVYTVKALQVYVKP